MIPAEPPVGTWVRDRFGATHVRIKDADRRIGWACSPTGYYAFGKWEAMWEGRGPLVECAPWGREVPEVQACPICGGPTRWDTEHSPHSWRHDKNESRWCDMDDTPYAREPVMPPDTGVRWRDAKPWLGYNAELWV